MLKLKPLELLTANLRGSVILIILVMNALITLRELLWYLGVPVFIYEVVNGSMYVFYGFYPSVIAAFLCEISMLALIGIYIGAPRLATTFDGLKKLYVLDALALVVVEFVYYETYEYLEVGVFREYFTTYYIYYIDCSYRGRWCVSSVYNDLDFFLSFVLLLLTVLVLMPMLKLWMQNNVCPECSSRISPDFKYCPFCGRQL